MYNSSFEDIDRVYKGIAYNSLLDNNLGIKVRNRGLYLLLNFYILN